MSDPTFELDKLSAGNLQLLQAYSLRATALKAALEQYDGWVERIDDLEELDSEVLTQLHGQLIALGHLKFEISGRNVGLRYQLSPRGKQALDREQQKAA